MREKKLLITGGSGFLGSRIAACYQKTFSVIKPGHDEMDITDQSSVERLFSQYQPDVVIHCAAVSDTGACEREPEYSERINVFGSENIAKAAAETGAKLLLCSSDQVYFGCRGMRGHREEEEVHPAGVYGRQKLEAEKRCLAIAPDSVALRLSWMYDPISVHNGEHGDLIRTILKARKEGTKLTFPVHDLRGITYVSEVVHNLEKAMALPGGVYNFGSENGYSTYETLLHVFRRLGWGTERLYKNEEAFRDNPRNISMDTEKIRKLGINFSATAEGMTACLEGGIL